VIVGRRLVFVSRGNQNFHFPFKKKKNPNIYVYEKQKTLIYDNRLEKTTLGN
jgi:hypothetical protein